MTTPQHDQLVRELAYRIWEEEGCPAGRELENWREAERRLRPVEPPVITEASEPATPVPRSQFNTDPPPRRRVQGHLPT